MNGVTWSLSCEMFFYAIFPFVYTASHRLRLRTQWLVVGVLFLVAASIVSAGSFADENGALALIAGADPLVRAPEFLIGVVGARTLQAGHRFSWPHVLPVLLFAALGSAFVHGSPAEATWTAPIFLLVIVFVAQSTLDGRRLLDQRWLVYSGKVSFCFYLVHQLVLREVFQDLGVGLAQSGLALVLACGLAVALHHGVEVPGQRLIVSRRSASRALS